MPTKNKYCISVFACLPITEQWKVAEENGFQFHNKCNQQSHSEAEAKVKGHKITYCCRQLNVCNRSLSFKMGRKQEVQI